MKSVTIFEDEAIEFVRKAEKNGKAIIIKNNSNTSIIHYQKHITDYDGIYVSEWYKANKKSVIGYTNREMAMIIYNLCNKYQSAPIMI